MAVTLHDMTSTVLDMSSRLNEVERQFGRTSDTYQAHLNEFAKAWHDLSSFRYDQDMLLPKRA